MVFYRKYRPQNISDLDLPKVKEKLSSVLSSKELPHAFLFTGSKGLGKTSAARILAKAINCVDKKGIEPCNKCKVCTSITNGSNIDVLEIDGASNGGVEEIRTLRERIKFAPSGLLKKVYIIDEVHMLSTGAFNALLKTLEEPPAHVVFILATTELHKLPSTVVSRTFQVTFEKPTNKEMVQSLARIVKGEKLNVEDGVLEELAKISDNAFRDGAKNLEELVFASKGNKITKILFDQIFKTGGVKDEVLVLLRAYEVRDAKKALETISKLIKNGTDFKVVIERLVDHLRGLLMLRNGIESDEPDVAGLNMKNIQELLSLANEAYAELKMSVIPSLPLELMTVKYCILEVGDEKITSTFTPVAEVIKPNLNETVKNKKGKNDKNLLQELIDALNNINKPGAALLRSANSAVFNNDILTITTPFPIHAERLRSEKVFPDLKKITKDLFGDVELKITIS